jgi:hypothetical protein
VKRLLTLAILLATAAPALAQDASDASTDETAAKKDDGVSERDVVEVKAGKKPIKRLTIDNQLGDVRIVGHDGKGIVIYAYKHGPDDAALDQLRVSLLPDPDGPVKITTAIDRGKEKTTLPAGDVRIDLVIEAPRDAKVEAHVGNGELVLRNMDAGGDLDAGAGAITVENVEGTVYARSVDGNQSFEEVFGDLDAQALTADLSLDTIHGKDLVATVHDGTIEATKIRSKNIELRTTTGKIHLEGDLQLGGKLVVASRSGDVDVTVKAAGALKVKALAGGKVTLDGADTKADQDGDWVRARYGEGSKKKTGAVEMRSKYGNVAFNVRFAVVE